MQDIFIWRQRVSGYASKYAESSTEYEQGSRAASSSLSSFSAALCRWKSVQSGLNCNRTRLYFLVFLACATKFSITPSNASLSPSFSSVFFFQNSKTSLARLSRSVRPLTCNRNSSSVIPVKACSVVEHNCLADTRSRSGTWGVPFFLLELVFDFSLPLESTETLESLASVFLTRDNDLLSVDVRSEPFEETLCNDGRTNFFCFEAGRISSRSTGTPKETRKSRLMLDLIQSGG